MRTAALPFRIKERKVHASKADIVDFYDEATEDYSFWSRDLNMHFGYLRWGVTHPLDRDGMLTEMNEQIYKRLQLPTGKATVADLGCGMGGPMRHFLAKNNKLSIMGVTLSPLQVRQGNRMLKGKKGLILEENFERTSMASDSMDGVIGVESLCHSGHSNAALKEAHRVLKPGARFVMADAFLKRTPSSLCLGSRYSYRKLCEGWSLDGLDVIHAVEQNLLEIGFRKVKVEDVSLQVAPSVLHVPFAICGFLLKKLWTGSPVKRQSWNNLKASFYALISGLHRKDFGYYLITAKK